MKNDSFNVISNNCVGSRFYERVGVFPNPFMWNSIKLKDFLYLIENFEKINLLNIKSFFTNGEITKDKNNDRCSTILLDDKVKIYYLHHHFDESHLTEKVFRNEKSKKNFENGILDRVEYDMTGCDILKYLEKCWFKRLNRMNNKLKKVFVYWDSQEYTNDDIEKLFKLNGDFIIVVISEKNFSKYTDKSHFYIEKKCSNTIKMAEVLSNFLSNI